MTSVSGNKMWRSVVMGVTMLAALPMSPANAQIGILGGRLTAPVFGATSGVSPPEKPPDFGGGQLVAKRHLTPSGGSCISTFAFAQAQAINNRIYNHILTIGNDCSQPIKVRVCYFSTQQCITAPIPPYKREQKILGVFPVKDFRFELREYAD